MIKFNVLYPSSEGARFDHVYYRDKHMPMLANRLGSACAYYEIDIGIGGRMPGAPSPYLASCSVFSESLETFQQALAPHAREIMADIRIYTDTRPVIWISEVVVQRGDAASTLRT